MNKRIFYIVLGALLIFLFLLGLWWWFFSGGSSTVSQTGDLFGSGTTTSQGGAGGNGGNNQAPIGSTVGGNTNVQTPIGGGGSDPSVIFTDSGEVSLSDATWLDGSGGSSGGSSGGQGSLFNPTPINSVDNSSLSGTPYIVNSPSGQGSGTEVGLAAGLLGAAAGCVAQYAASQATVAAGSLGGLGFAIFSGQVRTYDQKSDVNEQTDTVIECVVRALARIAIRQITAETVNWINSGFEGKPQFVENYQQFFTSVADQAAGQFIQGSDLAFLCSPFQLQVRVAIAQSYARRQSGAAQSCTLSDAVGNVERFLEGDFSEGGWPGLLSFTTTPTNNPFGAYMYGQVALNTAQGRAVEDARLRISPEGFLAQRQCEKDTQGNDIPSTCKIVTPGSIVAEPLRKVIGSDVDSLQLANSIDEIMNALVNSLIKKAFQGLSSLGSSNGSASLGTQDAAATQAATELLQELQAYVQYAQQYGTIQQGSIQDIQNAQGNLSALENCWAGINEGGKQADAAEKIAELELLVEARNNQILAGNAAVARVQELQSNVYLARSLGDVQAVRSEFQAAQFSGQLITQTTVSLAQQDRTTLQAQMASINATTNNELQECYEESN